MNYMSLPQSVTISFVQSGNQTDHIVQAFTNQVKEKQNTICMQQILMYQCIQDSDQKKKKKMHSGLPLQF